MPLWPLIKVNVAGTKLFSLIAALSKPSLKETDL